jgi:lysophospholipase L1-like esterase
MEELHILCLGDSLTEGFTRYGTEFHPYGPAMAEALGQSLPNIKSYVVVEGLSGDQMCPPMGRYMPRLQAKRELYHMFHPKTLIFMSSQIYDVNTLEIFAPSTYTQLVKDNKYDWIVILGGTNDLGWGRPNDGASIFKGLQAIQKECLDHGAKVLNMTVPETESLNSSLISRRNELNSLIRTSCDDSNM